jgi:hypothetical protein
MDRSVAEARLALRWFFFGGLAASFVGGVVLAATNSVPGLVLAMILMGAGGTATSVAVIGWGVMYGLQAAGGMSNAMSRESTHVRSTPPAVSPVGAIPSSDPVVRARKKSISDIEPLGSID